MRVLAVSANCEAVNHLRKTSCNQQKFYETPQTNFKGAVKNNKGFLAMLISGVVSFCSYINDIGKDEDGDNNPFPNDNWPDTAY